MQSEPYSNFYFQITCWVSPQIPWSNSAPSNKLISAFIYFCSDCFSYRKAYWKLIWKFFCSLNVAIRYSNWCSEQPASHLYIRWRENYAHIKKAMKTDAKKRDASSLRLLLIDFRSWSILQSVWSKKLLNAHLKVASHQRCKREANVVWREILNYNISQTAAISLSFSMAELFVRQQIGSGQHVAFKCLIIPSRDETKTSTHWKRLNFQINLQFAFDIYDWRKKLFTRARSGEKAQKNAQFRLSKHLNGWRWMYLNLIK